MRRGFLWMTTVKSGPALAKRLQPDVAFPSLQPKKSAKCIAILRVVRFISSPTRTTSRITCRRHFV